MNEIEGGRVSGSFTDSRENRKVVESVADCSALRWISHVLKPFSMTLTFKAAIEDYQVSGWTKSMFRTGKFVGKRA